MRTLSAVGVVFLVVAAVARPAFGDSAVYEDGLTGGWQDWSWAPVSIDLAATVPVHWGTNAIAVTFTGAWGGFQVGHVPQVDPGTATALRFFVHGGSAGGQQVLVRLGNNQTGALVEQGVSPVAGRWTEVDIPLAGLGTPTRVDYVFWHDQAGRSQPTFYLDDIALVTVGVPTPTPVPPGSGPALNVNAQADRRAISPLIYGMNFADEDLAADLRLPVRRFGGNSTTRYSWVYDTSNRASDWYFENIPEDNDNPGVLPDGSTTDKFIDQDRRTGTATIMTVPLIGWAPKARGYACGFSVARYGAQQSTDPWRPDCGNGIGTNGAEIAGNDPADTSVAIDPGYVRDWLSHLAGKYGPAGSGGVRFYNLDNEPMLWPDTHRDVHPAPTSYDEMRDRTFAYAAAIKAVDASAQTLGPVVWGWTAYFWSALDWAPGGSWWTNPQDRLAHGNVPFVEWYLGQMQAYEQQHGVRILDYLDLHYYPQASGVSLSSAGSAATQALRLRSTRSLWDPTYVDESWINEAVQLIPRLRGWIAARYPGTKTAITEYNWGALDHINGALAQADVLGIFGREGLDLATLWDPPTRYQPGAFAFRMYRNYDGTGGAFGDIGVRAGSGDQGQLAVYAAERSGDGSLTVMVVNKTAQSLTAALTVAGFVPGGAARVYRYGDPDLSAIVRAADVDFSAGAASVSFAASSITLLVVPASGAGTPVPTATPSTTLPPATATPTLTPVPPATATRTATATSGATQTATTVPTGTPTVGPRVRGRVRYSAAGTGVGNVELRLSGNGTVTTATEATGEFALSGVTGDAQLEPRRLGSVGGAVSALDASYVLQSVVGSRTLTAGQQLAGDVSGNGTLSAFDASLILQRSVGLIARFPVAVTCDSDWAFEPLAVPGAGLEVVPPLMTPGTCRMGAVQYRPLSTDVEGQDFAAVVFGDVTGNWIEPSIGVR
ncbi:hypothetical protein L6Q96_02485 [Candidatus Binatia bacterium]|nr:hypothetical protein [Candidatus Binatia bacterium]